MPLCILSAIGNFSESGSASIYVCVCLPKRKDSYWPVSKPRAAVKVSTVVCFLYDCHQIDAALENVLHSCSYHRFSIVVSARKVN